jgi:hypothetical protein
VSPTHSLRSFPRKCQRIARRACPSFWLPPVESCRGTIPIQGAKSRPDRKTLGSIMVAAIAVAPMTPMPGMVSSFARCCVLIRFSIDPINICTALKLRRQHNDARPRIDRQTCILPDVFRQGASHGGPPFVRKCDPDGVHHQERADVRCTTRRRADTCPGGAALGFDGQSANFHRDAGSKPCALNNSTAAGDVSAIKRLRAPST